MKKITFLIAMCFLIAMAAPTAAAQGNMNMNVDVPQSIQKVINDWPKASAKVAKKVYKHYGMPDAITKRRIIWWDKGGWNITMVRKSPIPHDFPVPHKDVLYQAIYYDVPVDQFDDLARFDGSVIVEETRGTIAARCNWFAANYIAINGAYEIITGQLTVQEARKKYGRMILKFMNGIPSPYYKQFIFEVPEGGTRDPGESVIPDEVNVDFPTKYNSDDMNGMDSMKNMDDMNDDMDNGNYMDGDKNKEEGSEGEQDYNDDIISKETPISGNDLPKRDKYMPADLAEVGANKSDKYGWYLTAEGRTLYMFKADTRYESSDCYGKCAEAWPPLLTSGDPEAIAEVVNEEMLGTIERRSGAMQVTYNGWPLYYYVKDNQEGKFTGQDLMDFGAEWYLMAPDGSYIHHEGGEGNMNGQDY